MNNRGGKTGTKYVQKKTGGTVMGGMGIEWIGFGAGHRAGAGLLVSDGVV